MYIVAKNTATGLFNMVRHPWQTIKGVGGLLSSLFTSDGRSEIVLAIEKGATNKYNEFCEGDVGTKGEIIGEISGEIILVAVPVTKITKATKATKINEVLSKSTKAIGKFEKGASKETK